MPIKIPNNLPAMAILLSEGVFAMDESRAFHQDIRPLHIAILNLMPTKQATEVQLLRLLGNTPLQLEVDLLHMESHVSKNTSQEYLSTFYKVFEDVKEKFYDGLIITGAPVELMDFEQVNYWPELTRILEWTKNNVTSTFHICWGAQAALYYHYGIQKRVLPAKMFGIFPHTHAPGNIPLLRGFDDRFYVPHSRHTTMDAADVAAAPDMEILSVSEESGLYLAATKDGSRIFATGHSEYDQGTLRTEYERDVAKGENIAIPVNYFKNDDPREEPVMRWRSHANLLFSNWLNYYVYQETPYDLQKIGEALK